MTYKARRNINFFKVIISLALVIILVYTLSSKNFIGAISIDLDYECKSDEALSSLENIKYNIRSGMLPSYATEPINNNLSLLNNNAITTTFDSAILDSVSLINENGVESKNLDFYVSGHQDSSGIVKDAYAYAKYDISGFNPNTIMSAEIAFNNGNHNFINPHPINDFCVINEIWDSTSINWSNMPICEPFDSCT